ncbi:hypothetical protein [Baia soyae]|uniref:hypothetical protein n=1 Tax=Baia soyae TaxID=1544746 RepID=UPI00105244A8|nr:hypothetical protein [Baia soyae]
MTLESEQRKICSSYTPFSKDDEEIGRKISDFLSQEQITLLQDRELLTTIVPGVSRELRTDDVTVYHCLFTDGDFGPDAI